jgi:hypothetical protein
MRKLQIVFALLFLVFAVLTSVVYASLTRKDKVADCNVYLRAIETVNLCTMAAPHLTLSAISPIDVPVATLYATTISGPCETYHPVYLCH